jgi:hypothetical protein
VTLLESDGRPAAAIVHDAQLDDDPELLQAAGAVVLLAAENAQLDATWGDSVKELGLSRADRRDRRARATACRAGSP